MTTTNIKIIGMGGIGTALIDPLCRYLNYDYEQRYIISIIDGDNFEESNQTRQQFDRLGNKADITIQRLKPVFRNILFKSIPEFATPESISYLITDNDIVFMGVDNHKTRKLVSDHVLLLDDIILISGGNELTDGNVQIFIKEDGINITQPIANGYHPEILYPQDRSPDEISCGEIVESSPQIIFTNMTIAVYMLNAFYSYHQNGDIKYDEVYIDIMTGKSSPRKRT